MDVEVVLRVMWSPRSLSIISDAHAGPVHPFCGADKMQSTPVAFMSTDGGGQTNVVVHTVNIRRSGM
jgi:hypothetical protein